MPAVVTCGERGEGEVRGVGRRALCVSGFGCSGLQTKQKKNKNNRKSCLCENVQ